MTSQTIAVRRMADISVRHKRTAIGGVRHTQMLIFISLYCGSKTA